MKSKIEVELKGIKIIKDGEYFEQEEKLFKQRWLWG